MGVKGLWTILLPAAEERSLTEIAVSEGFVANRRGLQNIIIGIDASIWINEAQFAFRIGHAQAGQNPELRIIFFKLARLLQAPVMPLFVFDGPRRPSVKRGVKVVTRPNWLTAPLQELLDAFGYHYYTAPGEAEAELAYLNEANIVDAVITDDNDAFIFGAMHVIRNWKATVDSVKIYSLQSIAETPEVSLTRGGMILIALLSGGDYNPAGLPNCGVAIGHGLAQAGLGDSLLTAALNLSAVELDAFLVLWRQELREELSSNSSGCLSRKYVSLAKSIPESCPDPKHLLFYAKPTTSHSENTTPDLSFRCRLPDIGRLARICKRRFDWKCSVGGFLTKFNQVWDGLCVRMLCASDCFSSLPQYGGFGMSSVHRIRSSKLAKAPAAALRLYRVDYSTSALNSSIDNSESVPGATTLHSVWIPAPLLDYSLPGMVADYKN